METCSPDAPGLDSGRDLELSEDSTEVPTDAPSGERARSQEPSAGTTEPELSEEPREVAEPALPSEEEQEPGRDADSSEEEEAEEEADSHSAGLDSEDSTSEEPER